LNQAQAPAKVEHGKRSAFARKQRKNLFGNVSRALCRRPAEGVEDQRDHLAPVGGRLSSDQAKPGQLHRCAVVGDHDLVRLEVKNGVVRSIVNGQVQGDLVYDRAHAWRLLRGF
jgi:hypothetical protein